MMDDRPEKYEGEAHVWDCIKNNLWDQVICYYNRQINNREFDFCLLIEDVGLVIIEVKGWSKKHIKQVLSPDRIVLFDGTISKSPKKQARGYSFDLRNLLYKKYNIRPNVMEMVCYPFLSEKDCKLLGLDIVSEPEFTLYAEDISTTVGFAEKINRTYLNTNHSSYDKMRNSVYDICRHYFEPTYMIKSSTHQYTPYSSLYVFAEQITINKIDEILQSYFKGTKQIIFTNFYEDLQVIEKHLLAELNNRNIYIDNNNLSLSSHIYSNDSIIKNGRINLFNFEAYFIENYTLPYSFVVNNGDFKKDEYQLINDIQNNILYNFNQYKIEHAETDKNILIRAGAGTGKTYSMVSRIAYLCHPSSNSGVYDLSNEIAMLTFTTEAATNMKLRLKRLFKNYFILTKDTKYLELVSSVEQMRISTIHSFAQEVIQKTSSSLGIGTNFSTISGDYDRTRIFDKLLDEYLKKKNQTEPMFFENLPFDLYTLRKMLLSFANQLYNKGCDIKNLQLSDFGNPIDEMPYINDIFKEVIIKCEQEYAQFLFENNSVRLSEYMVYLNKCVSDDSFNKNLYKFKYMFLDEFQDTDDSQIEAIKKLQHKLNFHLFIVGDLKQSIYRFRGATMDAFNKMGCDNDSWISFSLNINYRSDLRLLKQYDVLFQYLGNEKLLPYDEKYDKLSGIKENNIYTNGQQITVYTYTNSADKSEILSTLYDAVQEQVHKIKYAMQTKDLSLSERTIAILTRTNYEINNILKNFKRLKDQKSYTYDIQSDSTGDLYSLDCAIDLCKLTSAFSNPYNITFLYDLIQSNNVNIDFSLSSIIGKSEEEKLNIFTDCLDKFYLSTLNKTWSQIIHDVQNEPILKMLHIIYESTAPWKKYSSDESRQQYYRDNYELVFEELSNANKRNYLTLDSINESLHIAITTGTEKKSKEISSDTNGVRVICTTVHKSKGLEYGTVILPFTDLNISKSYKNKIDTTYIDGKIGYCFYGSGNTQYCNEYYDIKTELKETAMEESRILYVALTRAINNFIWFYNSNSNNNSWGKMLLELPKE